MIVADASILAHYVIDGEKTKEARLLWGLDSVWMVPAFWLVEFQSVLWKYVRFQGMPESQAVTLLEYAMQLFSANERQIDHDAALREAIASGITVYDAQYVALARQLNVRCVTLDKALQKACPDRVILVDAFLADPSGGGLLRETPAKYKVKRKTKTDPPKRAARD
jgi:predicted nucleic acid-binding protein